MEREREAIELNKQAFDTVSFTHSLRRHLKTVTIDSLNTFLADQTKSPLSEQICVASLKRYLKIIVASTCTTSFLFFIDNVAISSFL